MALAEEFEKQGIWLFKYRSYIPFAVLAIGTFIYLRSEITQSEMWFKQAPWDSYYLLFCMLVSLLGFGIRVYTVGHTPANTSGRNTKVQVADTLNTNGIYSIVRHPLYLGNFFMWLGPVMLTGQIWFIVVFCMFYWIYYERIMFSEEQFLRRKFGEVYTSWAEKQPAFIPAFRNFIKPSLPFSWKKVLKKEKNGFAAIFIIFTFMNVTGELVTGQKDFSYALLICCLISCVLYLILKYLKRKTHLLDEEGR